MLSPHAALCFDEACLIAGKAAEARSVREATAQRNTKPDGVEETILDGRASGAANDATANGPTIDLDRMSMTSGVVPYIGPRPWDNEG